MNRRNFLKNSIGALLFTAIGNNAIAKSIVNTTNNPHDILFYLIRTKNGKLKIHGTKWIDITTKNISPFKFELETFKPLGIYKSNIAYKKKRELWKEYNCDGICAYVNYEYAVKRGHEAKKTGQLKSIAPLGGKVGGRKNRDNKHGLFALTPEQKSIAGTKGGLISIAKMTEWCRKNNHWQNLAILQKGVQKSEEQKKKISQSMLGKTNEWAKLNLTGKRLPQETCEKMSKSRLGKKHSQTTIQNLKKAAQKRCVSVSKFTLDGIWIEDFIGLSDAGKSIGDKNGRGIQLVCNYYRDNLTKGSKQRKGFIWKYKNTI